MPWYLDMRVWTHAALTGIMAGLSLALMLPGDSMANPSWAAFHKYAEEPGWSYAFMAAAWVGAMGLVSARRWVMVWSSLCLSTAHTMIAVLFLQSALAAGVANTAVATYTINAALGFVLCMVRCAGR